MNVTALSHCMPRQIVMCAVFCCHQYCSDSLA